MEFLSIAQILCPRSGSKICMSVVHTIMVDMVGYHPLGHFDNFLVYVHKRITFSFTPCHISLCIKAISSFSCNPFVSFKPLIIGQVNLCVLRSAHANPAEGVAVAHPAIQKYRPNDQAFQPIENVACKSSDFLPSAGRNVECRIMNLELSC